MHHRHRIARQLGDAPDIPRRDQVRLGRVQIAQLPLPQAAGDFRLQQVIGAGRPAADMRLLRLHHPESRTGQQLFRFRGHLRTMLQAARRVIRNRKVRLLPCRRIAETRQEFGDVHGHGRNLFSLRPPCIRFRPEHEAIVLHRGAAAAGVDHNRIQPAAALFRHPRRDIRRQHRRCHRWLCVLHALEARLGRCDLTTSTYRTRLDGRSCYRDESSFAFLDRHIARAFGRRGAVSRRRIDESPQSRMVRARAVAIGQ
ncbi:hypothetical protein GALL_518410 [mine drainage metagenome]|uniref:Uncharacterized protein n=1 Tax=mine drainage metagenome TaxID=410659 RepID=A0A1J5PMR1_9ZZZZ